MWFLVTKGCGTDNLLAEVADGVSLAGDHLAQRRSERSASLDELALQYRHSTSYSFNSLEQSVQDRFLQTPVVVLLVFLMLELNY